MVDILSGVITGSNHGGKVRDPFDDFNGPQNVGHLFILMKPNLFINNYNKRIKENIKKVKSLSKIKKGKDIFFPGQNKFERLRQNSNKKIKIPSNILKDINILLK